MWGKASHYLVWLFFIVLNTTTALAQIQKESFYLYGQKFTVTKPILSKDSTKKLPLIVLLHGCKIGADEMLQLTNIEKWVEQKQFMVLTPEQSRVMNWDNCWNWFLGVNQQTVLWGELTVLKEALNWTTRQYPVTTDQIYLMGFSSGASIATNMFYCYPETFSGVTVHSGVAFKSAENLMSAEEVLTQGSSKSNQQLAEEAYACKKPALDKLSYKKMLIIQGTNDQRVVEKNAEQVAQQFMGFWDIADDARSNESILVKKNSSYKRDKEFPVKITRYQIGNKAHLDFVSIKNLSHRWSGGSNASPYGEPKAFDVTLYSLQSFLNSSKGSK